MAREADRTGRSWSLGLPSLLSLFRQQGSFPNVDDATAGAARATDGATRLSTMARSSVAKARPAEWTFVVTSGKSEVVRPAPNGAMILVNVLHPGDWGGIMGLAGKMQRLARMLAAG